ncbi:PRC and DUF2382 domain-containing protein [Corynebacterium bovis]|uniref:PRC and DUF2382 domain-containing protein n=1 Tax=Corynebacterium bovis TaxID=36808 RepID=UPI00244974F8|nr:PRC and DUF2382 domain-containing protein [Corynebacterium bovis]MDH2455636.1 PRC and DUF2382 domain-containing protein [Corynebacterium bovis]
MAEKKNIKDLFDATAYDKSGDKLGSVKEIFVDDRTGQPTFVEVNHGLFGMSSSLVPLRGHRLEDGKLNLAFEKDRIKDAPGLDAEKGLTPEDQNRIYAHYGLDRADEGDTYVTDADRNAGQQQAAAGAGTGAAAGAGTTSKGGTTTANGAGDQEIIRSEEQLNVDKDRVATGEARLRKYVTTEKETVEVPVSREEVRVERTPISEADAKNYDGNIGEQEASVTLHEDKVNVSKESVPVEKVSLGKEQVTDTKRYSDDVRKEHIDTEGVKGTDEVDGKRK